MSWQPTRDPVTGETPCPFIETVVIPRTADIGGFEVRRAVPSMQKRSVGPFVFVDELGPTLFGAGEGIDVPPHPHIGLATVTYLFAGEQTHRDSLGTRQLIRPGDVNWMTAGSGIAHSERTPPALRATGSTLFGVQTWVALPAAHEEVAPSFAHHGIDDLPVIEDAGKSVRLIVGSAYGARSPVATFSETLYLDAALQAGAVLPLPAGMRSGRSMSSPAGSGSAATILRRSASWSFGPATWSRSRRWRRPGCWSSAASRSMARASCGGTSSPAAANASSRPRKTGAKAASARSRTRPSGCRCRKGELGLFLPCHCRA